jgi:hypothetical protein
VAAPLRTLNAQRTFIVDISFRQMMKRWCLRSKSAPAKHEMASQEGTCGRSRAKGARVLSSLLASQQDTICLRTERLYHQITGIFVLNLNIRLQYCSINMMLNWRAERCVIVSVKRYVLEGMLRMRRYEAYGGWYLALCRRLGVTTTR